AGRRRDFMVGSGAPNKKGDGRFPSPSTEMSIGSASALLQVLADELRHRKHVDGALSAEHRFKLAVRVDHPPVLLVLQTVLLKVGPQLLGDLSAGHRFR